MQKGVKTRFQALFGPNSDLFMKKGKEKIRKGRGKMIHWEPTEEWPKGKSKVWKSLKNGTLFDGMKLRECKAPIVLLCAVKCGEAKRKGKRFCMLMEKMYIDTPWSSKVKFFEFVVKWNKSQSQLLCSFTTQSIILAGSNRLNSTTESLILAQDERWRCA